MLVESDTTQFTLLAIPTRIQIDGSSKSKQQVWGRFLGTQPVDSTVMISAPNTNQTFTGRIGKGGAWSVKVPANVLRNAHNIDVSVTSGSLTFTKKHVLSGDTASQGQASYKSAPSAHYSPPTSGISTTTGRTNPSFRPKYSP